MWLSLTCCKGAPSVIIEVVVNLVIYWSWVWSFFIFQNFKYWWVSSIFNDCVGMVKITMELWSSKIATDQKLQHHYNLQVWPFCNHVFCSLGFSSHNSISPFCHSLATIEPCGQWCVISIANASTSIISTLPLFVCKIIEQVLFSMSKVFFNSFQTFV